MKKDIEYYKYCESILDMVKVNKYENYYRYSETFNFIASWTQEILEGNTEHEHIDFVIYPWFSHPMLISDETTHGSIHLNFHTNSGVYETYIIRTYKDYFTYIDNNNKVSKEYKPEEIFDVFHEILKSISEAKNDRALRSKNG